MKEGIGLKRLPILLIALILITATGCGANQPIAAVINRSFCRRAAVEQNGRHYEAEVTATPEQCAAVFLLPEAMEGMTMTSRNNSVTVQYGQNQKETPLPNPRQCFLYWLDRALAQPDAAVSRREDAFVLQGALDGQSYLLTIDKASSQPLYFEMDSLDLTIRFQKCE